jgi:hypothetical protein
LEQFPPQPSEASHSIAKHRGAECLLAGASAPALLGRAPADWYCDLKNGAVGAALDEPQFVSVIFDHSKTDGDPQPHTARFCREERFEYPLSILQGEFQVRSSRSMLHG